MTKKLNENQKTALLKYSDGELHNETQLKIRPQTYMVLKDRGLIERRAYMLSAITDAGRKALSE